MLTLRRIERRKKPVFFIFNDRVLFASHAALNHYNGLVRSQAICKETVVVFLATIEVARVPRKTCGWKQEIDL